MTLNYTTHYGECAVDSSNLMKIRHSTICTLYSSQTFLRVIWTKCIRRNMRSTCQWSCVLQFTWRRAVCCGLHRPMSQVIPCLGLNLSQFYIVSNSLISTIVSQEKWSPFRYSFSAWGFSRLPWRSPLEINNSTSISQIKASEYVACEYQGFCIIIYT